MRYTHEGASLSQKEHRQARGAGSPAKPVRF